MLAQGGIYEVVVPIAVPVGVRPLESRDRELGFDGLLPISEAGEVVGKLCCSKFDDDRGPVRIHDVDRSRWRALVVAGERCQRNGDVVAGRRGRKLIAFGNNFAHPIR